MIRRPPRSTPFPTRRSSDLVLLSATRCQDFDTQASLADYKQLDYLPKEGGISARIKLYQVNSPEKDKLDSLVRLLLHVGNQSSIVFLNYRESVERTANYLRSLGFKPTVYHGGLEQPVREEAIYKIMNGSSNILVSTDLGSRGLDIPDVENIINYHIPETYEAFVHRVDRKSTRLNSSHANISYAVFCLKKKIKPHINEYCLY